MKHYYIVNLSNHRVLDLVLAKNPDDAIRKYCALHGRIKNLIAELA